MRLRRRSIAAGLGWVAVLLWAGVIWWLLSLPPEKTPEIGFIDFEDKLGHGALYFVWGALICRAAEKSFRATSRTAMGVMSVLSATIHGIATEVYQAGIGRSADVLDLLADIAGAVAACYLSLSPRLKAIARRLRTRQPAPAWRIGRPFPSSPAKPGCEAAGKSASQGDEEE